MNKKIIALVICGITVFVLGAGVVILHLTISKQNVETKGTVISDVSASMSSTVSGDLSVSIAESAGGFDQQAMLAAITDYCNNKGITGDVVAVDAGFNEDDSFYTTIQYGGVEETFNYDLFSYK